jgi:putative flippase GtrA
MKSYLKTFLTWEAAGQFAKLAVIGVVNTVVYFASLNLFRTLDVPLLSRTTLSFAIATLVSYFLNRRWTFQIKRGWASIRETVKFFLINAAAWAVTAAIVLFADDNWGPLSRLEENLANVVATGFILLPKFASYRDIVFRSALRSEGRDPMASSDAAKQGTDPDSKRVPAHLPERSD